MKRWHNLLLELTRIMCCYMLMQFGSLEEFQLEFQDINQEEQVGRLHKMLAPHLLRSKEIDGSKLGITQRTL